MPEAWPNILVVDDESSIRHALRAMLAAMGFSVSEASTGEEALALVHRSCYDAVLLDINMPGMGGMVACREIRRAAPRLAILMLTVRDRHEEKVEALDAGADDYVTKPFHMGELTARVRAVVRRARPAPEAPEDSIRIGDLVLDRSRRSVFKSGRRLHLTPKEFNLLEFLMSNAGRPIAHNRLLGAVWGEEYREELEYLRTLIHQLRKKIEDDPARPAYLFTESWFGYRFR